MTKYLIALALLSMLACSKDPANNAAIEIHFDKTDTLLNYKVKENWLPISPSQKNVGPVLVLSRPLITPLNVLLTTSGTARNGVDYVISNPLYIPPGSVAVPIGLWPLVDSESELDEIGHIRIGSTDNASIKIDTTSATVKIIDNELSGLEVEVVPYDAASGVGLYDMDMYLWRETAPGSGGFSLVSKAVVHNIVPGQSPFVTLRVSEPDGLYALSYVYYSGASDFLNLQVTFKSQGLGTVDGKTGTRKIFTAHYRQSNINMGESVIKEQFFTKKGIDFTNITTITVPLTGS